MSEPSGEDDLSVNGDWRETVALIAGFVVVVALLLGATQPLGTFGWEDRMWIGLILAAFVGAVLAILSITAKGDNKGDTSIKPERDKE